MSKQVVQVLVYDEYEDLVQVPVEADVYGRFALHPGVSLGVLGAVRVHQNITTLTYIPLGASVRQSPSRIAAVNLLLRMRHVSDKEMNDAIENRTGESFNRIKSIILRWRADWNVPPENQ